MGEIIEEIGGWFDCYIFRPLWKLISMIITLIIAAAGACIPIAAVKYLFFS